MPAQLEIADGRRYRLRHVKPAAAGIVVLGQTFGFQWLPADPQPHSKDLASGSWTGRLGDAGEFSLIFPNTTASDGIAWRDRFDVAGHLQFIEIYRDDTLEFVGVIVKVDKDRNQVVVSGWDGWFLLKKCYVRDRQILLGPRDLIETYTSVPVALSIDNFQGASLDATKWTALATGGSTVTEGYGGLALSSTAGATAGITSTASVAAGTPWSLTAYLPYLSLGAPGSGQALRLQVTDSALAPTIGAELLINNVYADTIVTASIETFLGNSNVATVPGTVVSTAPTFTLLLESDGRWIRAYLNGGLAGILGDLHIAGLLHATVLVQSGGYAVVGSMIFRAMAPFLTRGADRGDWVLPSGNAAGGLHGRYYNDLDMQGYPYVALRALSPARVSYADRLDAGVILPTPPQPGAGAGGCWSARWFGAIYLKLSSGSYQLSIVRQIGVGARLYVGRTTYGAQIIDQWNPASVGAESICYVDAAALGGRDGWYPIILEAFNAIPAAGTLALLLKFSPTTYVDPGGTSIGYGAQSIYVPATSLAPFGVVDDRYEGQSQFDIVQKVADAYGYQACVEPMQLESGEFPGRLSPRVREGHDYDEIIEPDDLDRRSPISGYQLSTDATDQVAGIYGSGGQSADAQGGKVTTEVFDAASVSASLFDLQGWVDAGDISNPGLLAARINSQLGLQLSPWQNIVGDPTARDRLSDSFPLTGALTQLRWRPGDGVRLRIPDVGLEDLTPRQMIQVTREFTSEGRTATKIGFRQRPRDPSYLIREALRAATVPQRQSQAQIVALTGTFVNTDTLVPGGAFSSVSVVTLLAQDTILAAHVRISFMSPIVPTDLEINGVLRGASLGGPWSLGAPIEIDIRGFATPYTSTDTRLFARLKNVSTAYPTPYVAYSFQIVLTVLHSAQS